MLKFKSVLKSRATIKEQKEYLFPELKDEDIEFGRKATPKYPFLKYFSGYVLCLYMWKGKLQVSMYHSYDKFEEI